MMKTTSIGTDFIVSTANRHTNRSHVEDYSIGLTNTQKDMLKGAVQQDLIASANHHRRALERSSPENRIKHSKLRLTQKFVGNARKEVLLLVLH